MAAQGCFSCAVAGVAVNILSRDVEVRGQQSETYRIHYVVWVATIPLSNRGKGSERRRARGHNGRALQPRRLATRNGASPPDKGNKWEAPPFSHGHRREQQVVGE